jgi:hypothetical protein
MAQETGEHGQVRYFDGVIPVLIGDHVEVRGLVLFFRKKTGRVVYVPGISKPHSEMEHNGLTWVGVQFDDGTFTGTYVEPQTNCLQKIVTFLKRGENDVPALQPDDSIDD